MRRTRSTITATGLTTVLLLVGCGSDEETSTTAVADAAAGATSLTETTDTATTETTATETAEATDTAATETTDTTASTTKVSLNTATEEELTAAMEGAGVTNAADIAAAVVAGRPYDAESLDVAKLTGILGATDVKIEDLPKIASVLGP